MDMKAGITDILKKHYYDLPLGLKLNLSNMLIIIIPMILLSFLANKFSTKIMVEKSINNTVQGLQIVNRSIDSHIKQVEYLSEMTVNNYNVFENIYALQKRLQQSSNSDYLAVENRSSILRSLDSIVGNGSIIKSIIVYTEYGIIYSSSQIDSARLPTADASFSNYLGMVKKARGEVFWRDTSRLEYFIHNNHTDCLSLFRALVDGKNGKVYGAIEIDIDQAIIAETFSIPQNSRSEGVFIIDGSGNIILTEQVDKLYTNISKESYYPWILQNRDKGEIFNIKGEDYLVSSVEYGRLGWHIVGFTKLSSLTEDNYRVTLLIFFIGSLCIIFAIIVSLLNSRVIIKPLISLSKDMNNASQGDMTVRSVVKGNDEIGRLAGNFNTLIERISDLMDRIYEEQKKKRKYELQALQSQIKPHFLYNSLESVCSLAELKKNRKVVEMVESLSRFYRTTLSSGRNVVTLREEFENIKHYLIIQKIRYRDKFDYTIDLDESLGDEQIVKLTLQPLVENAIYHGLRQKPGKGAVNLSVAKNGKTIVISVVDNGIGFNEDEFCRIITEPDNDTDKKSFGLKNVNDRLKLYFGQEYGLRIFSGFQNGTRIDVVLPYGKTMD